ncbi:ankyrin repeat domain-containing protein [Helicobacter sp. 23-1044]
MTKNLLLIFMLAIAQIQIAWANYDRDLISAAVVGDLNEVKSLISKGADVNMKDEFGGTVLMKASMYGHFEIVKFLVSKGANVNAKDGILGFTALMSASIEGHFEVVKFLVKNGANVNAKDMFSETALSYTENSEIKQFLINNGARE